MKQFILMAVCLLSIRAAVVAGTNKSEHRGSASVVLLAKAPFDNIVVNGDMDIVLIESPSVQLEVKGEQQHQQSVKHYVRNKTLYILGKANRGTTRPVVYVSIRNLKYIEVNGKSNVSSKGVLNSDILKVRINDEVTLQLRNHGTVLLEADEDIDLKYQAWIKDQQIPGRIHPTDCAVVHADLQMDQQFLQLSYSAYAVK